MRSEKEIRERIEGINPLMNSACEVWTLKWVLEGEPRYSVAEMYKIWEFIGDVNVGNFLDFFKDSKKVQEALE